MRAMNLHLSRVGVVAAAVVAIVASATGGAVADRLITSDDIKNRAIERQDLADGSVGPRILRDNSVHLSKLSPTVRERLAEAGTRGPAGPAGNPGLAGYEVITRSMTMPVGTHTLAVVCPSGKRVLAGGWSQDDNSQVLKDGPSVDGTRWEITLAVNPLLPEATVDGYAVCAAVG